MFAAYILATTLATLSVNAVAQQSPPLPVLNDPIALPQYQLGDRWVYQGINHLLKEEPIWKLEQIVDSIELPNVVFRYKNLLSSDPAIAQGAVGTTRYMVSAQSNIRGDLLSGIFENVRFPLQEGMTWTHALKRKSAEGDAIEGEYTAKAIGWEDVQVPAGSFKAMKIQHTGWWKRPEKGGISGREEATVWYSPVAKRNVKALHIDYDSKGRLNDRFETQLVEYELQKAP